MKVANQSENQMKVKKSIQSFIIKMTALLAFIAINFIGYNAFSMEAAVKTTLAEQAQLSAIPSCELAPAGYIENHWKNIRIQVGGALVAGAESLSDLGQQLKKLVVEHKCLPAPVSCTLATEGLALGAWVKHRVVVQDLIAFGGDTTARLVDQFNELKNIGVCE